MLELLLLSFEGHPNERWLFHGTRPSNVHKIIHEGFDHRVSNDYGMFGSGIYFAEKYSSFTLTLLNAISVRPNHMTTREY
jgi:hypothetical protein